MLTITCEKDKMKACGKTKKPPEPEPPELPTKVQTTMDKYISTLNRRKRKRDTAPDVVPIGKFVGDITTVVLEEHEIEKCITDAEAADPEKKLTAEQRAAVLEIAKRKKWAIVLEENAREIDRRRSLAQEIADRLTEKKKRLEDKRRKIVFSSGVKNSPETKKSWFPERKDGKRNKNAKKN
jgi:hypothetical protein